MPRTRAKPKPPAADLARLERQVLDACLAWHRATHGPADDEVEGVMNASELRTVTRKHSKS